MVFEANNSKAVDYLEKKYNEKFVGIKWYDSDVYECYPASNEDWIVKVYFLEEDGKSIFKDDYYRWLKMEEFNELTNNIIQQCFPDVDQQVFCSFGYSWFPDEYTVEISISEAMAKSPRSISSNIWVFIAEDEGLDTAEFVSKCKKLTVSLREANYHTHLSVFAVQKDYMDRINSDNYPNYFLRNKKSSESGYLYEFIESVFVVD